MNIEYDTLSMINKNSNSFCHMKDSPIEEKNKQVVFLSGRVHPGESPSSWVMQGVIHYLTGHSEAAQTLR